MNFKEFYIEEGWKTDLAKKVAKAPFKLGAGLAKAGYRGAKAIYDDPKGYFPTVAKGARMLSPKSIASFGQSMAPEYQKQFAVRPKVDTGESIFAGKTLAEIQGKVLQWRTKNITDRDGTPGALRAEQELESLSKTPGRAAPPGGADNIEFTSDGKFFDSGYIPPGSSSPKVFTNIGHYANTVLDSMMIYAQKGYPMKDTVRFLRFDKKALDLLKKHGYLYTGS